MNRIATLLLALVVPMSALAADYRVLPANSELGFTAVFQGESFDGRFGQWTAAISYDEAHLDASKFDVTVTLASVKTGDSDRDDALPGSDFFAVAKFPTAHFVTTGFRRVDGRVIADGQLTLRGATRPMSLAVTFKPQANGTTLDVIGTLKRLDFGVGTGDFADTSVIGDEVKVSAHLQLAPK
ncbi:MAG TPA: YceI family protein [Rhodanobacter sp.]